MLHARGWLCQTTSTQAYPMEKGAVNFKEGNILKNNTKHKYHSVTSGGGINEGGILTVDYGIYLRKPTTCNNRICTVRA